MSTPQPITDSSANPEAEYLRGILDRQKAAFLKNGVPSYKDRINTLNTLKSAMGEYRTQIVDAVMSDFGHRSPHETMVTEFLSPVGEIHMTKMKLKGWMKQKKAPFSLQAGTGTGKVLYQPKGVVGVMGAWNYPAFLIFSPLIGVIAAGNSSIIKPPDQSVALGEVLTDLFKNNFDEDFMSLVTGDINMSVEFTKLPFDHMVYTGGTEIGRKVMIEAAKNLCPVTLEMGGKSPVIIADNYPIKKAVPRILMGKFINSGQTCIAPDYVLMSEGRQQEFIDTATEELAKRYPTLNDNEDITWIVNDRHYARINHLIEDAVAKGAKLHQVNPQNETITEGHRVIPPTFLTNVDDSMAVMQEEIFGPVLPIKTVASVDEAVNYVNNRPRPLALYYFDKSKAKANEVMQSTISGGACVNETMLHIAHENMPFGGSGPSGLGAYHGFDGFVEFSHKKGIFYEGPFSPASILKPPYGPKVLKAMNWIASKMA